MASVGAFPHFPSMSKRIIAISVAAILHVLLASGFLPASATTRTRTIEFETLSLEHGLSQSSVMSIVQDEQGFMWFATEDGLNKYDGYGFTVLRHDPNDTNTLSHTWILALLKDRSGTIWIGTFNEGLDRFDPGSETFTNFRMNPGDSATLSSNIVRVLFEDRSGTLWVGTDGGLNRLDRGTGTFFRYSNDPSDPASLSHDAVRAICEDRSGVLWIGTDGGGLNAFDPAGERFIRYKEAHSDPAGLPHNSIRALHVDASGALWIGTDGGLCRFDAERGAFSVYRHDIDDPSSISHNEVYSIYEDRSGTLWIGTNGGGINIFDRKKGTFDHYRYDPKDPHSLCYDEVYSIYEDCAGVIWIGTYGGGISKYDRKRNKFILYQHDPDDTNSLNADLVWSIYEDEDGILWIGTHGGGLNRLDRRNNSYRSYMHNPDDPTSLSNNIARIIYVDRLGTFWIGTHGGGLNRFNKKAGTFTSYQHDPDDPQSLSHPEIRWISEDRAGTLWIGTNGGGLNSFDRTTGRFKRYRHDPGDPKSLSSDFARVVLEDKEGTLWIGTQGGGINLMDRVTGAFTHIRHDPEDFNSLSSDHIISIFEDRSGTLWIGTWGGGFNRFNRDDGTFTSYSVEDGLPSDAVYGMLEDEDGRLWMSTNNGLTRFDPHTESFDNYNIYDGLQSNEFNGNSYHKSASGEMFFGGIRGFNAFHPADIKDNPHIPPVVITSFQKLNREVNLGVPVSEIDELVLSHDDYVFSFEFAALDYSVPDKNQYAYKMEGLDKEWVYTDASKRFASYTTLPPGRYIFRVKGANNDGVWNEEGTSVKLRITPPYWATWWFRVIVFLILAAGAIFAYHHGVKNAAMKAELQTAHNAQMAIMPLSDPDVPGFEISGSCITANDVGGDFYDYIWLDREKTRLGVVVGDVSGKAMEAAMIATMSNGMVFSKADELDSVKDIMTHLNRSLFLKTDEIMYTALCLASLEIDRSELTFSLAAFNEPLLKRGAELITLRPPGTVFPLGAFEDSTYSDETIGLLRGDVLIIYTDGISEAQNKRGEFYDLEGLKRVLMSIDTRSASAGEIKDIVLADVRRFCGSRYRRDDITLVVIKRI